MVKISKTYIPKETEKYMCAKHLAFFKKKLLDWKTDLKRSSNEALFNSSLDDNSTSADIVDQASSYTEKNVEMRAINRQIKLITKIDSALKKIQDGTYGFCEDTGEPIGLKRLMARPVATLCIAAQEKHEKEEKVYADDLGLGISPAPIKLYPFTTASLSAIFIYHFDKLSNLPNPISCHSCLAIHGHVAISAIVYLSPARYFDLDNLIFSLSYISFVIL